MPRVPPITGKADVPAEFHNVVDDVVGVFGQIRGPFSMLLHSPKLAEKMLQLVKFNRDESIVEPQLRSIAILASVREREAAYVWAAQVGAARRAELPESTIDLLRSKGDPARLSEDERNIVTYVRQLVRTNRVDQPVFDALKNRHGVQWLVELTTVANYFGLLSGVVNAFSSGGRVRVVPLAEADAILEGEVVGYSLEGLAFDRSAIVRAYRLRLTLNVEFRDVKRSEMLWRQEGLQETSDFQVEGTVSDTVARGQGAVLQAATEIGRKVVNLAVDRF